MSPGWDLNRVPHAPSVAVTRYGTNDRLWNFEQNKEKWTWITKMSNRLFYTQVTSFSLILDTFSEAVGISFGHNINLKGKMIKKTQTIWKDNGVIAKQLAMAYLEA